jgi:hypothetical protein
MVVNISYLEGVLPLKDNMWITAEPKYKNTEINFFNLHKLVSSDYRQYSPYVFNTGKKVKENWSNDNQSLLIYDIDDGMSIQEAKDMFSNYTYLITTTKSHRREKKGLILDRYRIILPATNIPTGELYWNMLQLLSERIPMDIQVNNPTGAFLGNSEAINIYNEGEIYDCSSLIPLAEYRMVNKLKIKKIQVEYEKTDTTDLKELKETLDRDIVKMILMDLGSEFTGNKFKLRDDDRTPSAIVMDSGYIIDFGDRSQDGDIFDILHRKHDMNFNVSISFVKKYKETYR